MAIGDHSGKVSGHYRVKSGLVVEHGGTVWTGGQRIPASHPAVLQNSWKLVPDKADPPRRASKPKPPVIVRPPEPGGGL